MFFIKILSSFFTLLICLVDKRANTRKCPEGKIKTVFIDSGVLKIIAGNFFLLYLIGSEEKAFKYSKSFLKFMEYFKYP